MNSFINSQSSGKRRWISWTRGLSRGASLAVAAACIVGAKADAQDIPGAAQQRNQLGGARALLESVKGSAQKDIAYVENGHERQKLDLYVPGNVKGPVPLVCFIHGGGWRNGQKSSSTAMPLIAQGYAVAAIGYRLSDAAQFPAQIEDCKAAIRWLRANAAKHGIDPARIGVWGPSAGGHLSALLGTSGDVRELEGSLGNAGVSSRVQAVCDFYGPADFLLGDVGGKADNPQGPVALMLGGPATKMKDAARQASPVTWISKDDPPFLIFQGGRDRTVPPAQSETFASKLKQAGVPVELVIFPDAEHGGPSFSSAETIGKIVAFFDQHLKNAKGALAPRP